MSEALNILNALADDIRMRSWKALEHGELCLCELIELLDRSPATVSKHLSILRQAGLLEFRKEGRWHHYRRVPVPKSSERGRALQSIDRLLEGEPSVRSDVKKLKQIRRTSRTELSACYRRK